VLSSFNLDNPLSRASWLSELEPILAWRLVIGYLRFQLELGVKPVKASLFRSLPINYSPELTRSLLKTW
jgi:hypothetical protein